MKKKNESLKAIKALRFYKPRTPGTRHRIGLNYRRFKVQKLKKSKVLRILYWSASGKNSKGQNLSVKRHSGNKKRFTVVDFTWRPWLSYIYIVTNLFYDPYRSGFIAKVINVRKGFNFGRCRYLLATKRVQRGDILNFKAWKVRETALGSVNLLLNIPVGSSIHSLENRPFTRAKFIRAAGCWGRLISRYKELAIVQLPSKEIRILSVFCRAVKGRVSNTQFKLCSKGKAGNAYWKGKKPKVRGSAMNAVDHPHGGGTGKCGIGRPCPLTQKGKIALGQKTRSHKKILSRIM